MTAPHRSGRCWKPSLLVVVWVLCIGFAAYIVLKFFSRPAHEWESVSDFGAGKRPVPIALHWAGGMIVLVTGPSQLVQPLRRRYPAVHRWVGRTYMLATAATCTGGLVYTAWFGTIGGWQMDVSFVVYAVCFGTACGVAWWHARHRQWQLHAEWAVRAFALGCGSALYRVLVLPLFIHVADSMSYNDKVDWLIVAAWLFWPLSITLGEVYVRYAVRGTVVIPPDKPGGGGDVTGFSPLVTPREGTARVV